MQDPTTSPLFGDNLRQGGGQFDPETMRSIAALMAMLQKSGMGQGMGEQGGQTFINPITQADALSQIRSRDNQINPVMGPSSNGIKFLHPGGRIAPPGSMGEGQDYQGAARSALITNLLSGLGQNLPGLLSAFRGKQGQQ